jgi:hypothetical protein
MYANAIPLGVVAGFLSLLGREFDQGEARTRKQV